jgi:hypothetical protein
VRAKAGTGARDGAGCAGRGVGTGFGVEDGTGSGDDVCSGIDAGSGILAGGVAGAGADAGVVRQLVSPQRITARIAIMMKKARIWCPWPDMLYLCFVRWFLVTVVHPLSSTRQSLST